MFDELLPVGLTGAARRLGVEPLEVVRLMVVSDSVTSGYIVTDDHLRKLAAVGGIEAGWWDGVPEPADARGRIRAVLGLLLRRAPNGRAVRIDNLWRGLPLEDQQLVEDALNVLADEELAEISNEQAGVMISVPPEQTAAVQALADGTSRSAGLDELVQG